MPRRYRTLSLFALLQLVAIAAAWTIPGRMADVLLIEISTAVMCLLVAPRRRAETSPNPRVLAVHHSRPYPKDFAA
jgi:hypothetical protein